MKYKALVITGKGEGKRIGFPTLNLTIPDPFPEHDGIYAGYILCGKETYRAVFHYGPIPTFNDPHLSLEAHIIDPFDGPAPSQVSFSLAKRLRSVKKFGSKETLVMAIEKDVSEAGTILNGKEPR